ncbi:MAG: DNA repair protein RecO [Acidimicrobiia bacterium]|nr:DNA repair protein RecO [Acidimicrobiia bacterium]
MGLRRDQGIVLRGYPFGDADRIVVLLSPNNGKVRTVAKGVRRTKSRFGGRLEPFCHVDVVLYEGRNLGTITQVTLVEPFHNLRNNLDAVLIAGSMVEVADIVAQENEASMRLFLLLQRGLRALDNGLIGPDLATAFLLKAATVVGVAPALEHCAGCGRGDGLTRFSFAAGGALCERCRTSGAYALRRGVTEHLSVLAGADLGALPTTDPEVRGEGLGVARRFLEYHLERRLVALGSLDG